MIVLVTFSVVFAGVGGWGTWQIVQADLEAEMDDKLRQVTGTTRVSFAKSSGTPAEDGWPSVMRPEPAATSK